MNRRRAAWIGAGAAIAGTALAAGKIVARRERRGEDPYADEDFAELPSEEIAPVVSFDGTLLHVRAAGDPDRPALVFAHGFAVDMTTWHFQWKDLSKDYRCILFDQRGHGRSGDAAGGDHSLASMGRDLKAVIDAAVPPDRPVVVLGHSMGGMTLLALAEEHPEMFDGRIAAAVLADTAAAELVRGAAGLLGLRLMAAAPNLGRRFASLMTRELVRTRVSRSDFAYMVAKLTNFGPHASSSMVEYVVDLSMRSPVAVWTAGVTALMEMDLRHVIRHVRCPTLVIVGDLDRMTPPASANVLKGELPDGRLVVLEGAGHMAPMERHEQFDSLVREFLDDVFATQRTATR
jgi:pimeloyl-ACP methyl ester carboxylesterase